MLGFLKHQREAGNIQHNDWSMRFRFTDVYLTLHQPRRDAFSWNKSLCMGKVECSNPGSDTHMSLKQVVTIRLLQVKAKFSRRIKTTETTNKTFTVVHYKNRFKEI